jgi:nicotinamidase-related amidase
MNTALIIVDVQQSLVEEGVGDAPAIIERLNGLLARARREGAPVVIVRDTRVEPDDRCHRDLQHEPMDLEVIKSEGDSFTVPELGTFLEGRGIGRVVIGGMQTDACVNATIRGAVARGLDVIVVSDAHGTIPYDGHTAEGIIGDYNARFAQLGQETGRVQLAIAADVTLG